MTMIPLNDNSPYKEELSDKDRQVLLKYAGKELDALTKDNPGLLVFPDCLGEYGDDWNGESLCHFRGNSLWAGNVVGFFGIGDVHVQIRSRFDSDDKQYFFHYMLCRVFGINMLNWQTTTNRESIWDFLPFLFPYFLKRAIKQGLFRSYRTIYHNDDHVRGTIDVGRHIRSNIPFNGKIAYHTREYTANNFLISLVRHTIETIHRDARYSCILNNDGDTRDAVAKITEATPDYSRHELPKVIAHNLRPVRHPFYTEYTALQKLCLQILRHEKMTFGEDKDKINGIVFKAEWLWEEYLATILGGIGFQHPKNTTRKSPKYLYQNNKGEIFPDFFSEAKKLVLDAKYKNSSIQREDRFQLISYIHVLPVDAGFLIYPNNKTEVCYEDGGNGVLYGGRSLGYITFAVPSGTKEFSDFQKGMQKSEDDLKNSPGIRWGCFIRKG